MSATVITDNFFTLVPAVHHRFQLPYFHADFQAPAAEELLLRSQENLGQFSKAQVQRLAQWIGAFWAGGFGGFERTAPLVRQFHLYRNHVGTRSEKAWLR